MICDKTLLLSANSETFITATFRGKIKELFVDLSFSRPLVLRSHKIYIMKEPILLVL